MAVCVSGGSEDRGNDRPGGVGASAGRPAAAGDGPSMANPVTRHAHFTGPTDWKLLLSGVDSLDVTVNVDWGEKWPVLFRALEDGKAAASGTKGVPWCVNPWVIKATGKPPMFRFHLQRPELQMWVGKSREGRETGNVYASLSAELLWHDGIGRAIELLESCIEELGGRILAIKPSRVDLCADFLIPEGLTLEFLRAHRGPWHSKTRMIEQGDCLQTMYVASPKALIQLRIYDKSLEVALGGTKDWFWPLWGIEPTGGVWRVEFQLRRGFLRQCKVHSIDELKSSLGGFWDYLTGKWISFRLCDDSNTTRRTVHPWWQEVADAKKYFGTVRPVERSRFRELCSTEWYVSHVAGCLAGFAARVGEGQMDGAWSALWEKVKEHWATRDFDEEYVVRRVHLGRDPEPDGGTG